MPKNKGEEFPSDGSDFAVDPVNHPGGMDDFPNSREVLPDGADDYPNDPEALAGDSEGASERLLRISLASGGASQ